MESLGNVCKPWRNPCWLNIYVQRGKANSNFNILCTYILSSFNHVNLTNGNLKEYECTCMFLSPPTLSDSDHEGLGPGRSGSMVRGSSFRWKSSKAQSMMRMMRWGGFPSLRTVEMSAALIVYRDKMHMYILYLEMVMHNCMPEDTE